MAEAHAAVAFSFAVSSEGEFDLQVSHEAVKAVWKSGLRSWKKRLGRFKNNVINGLYPASPFSFLVTMSVTGGLVFGGIDPSFGFIDYLRAHTSIGRLEPPADLHAACVAFSGAAWIAFVISIRYMLKALLSYKGWMFEPHGKISLATKVWMYLRSVRPLMDDEKFSRVERYVDEFKNGIGPRLQRYLVAKSWWATNYVSDWWEEYVYLRGRAPIMVNSNYYGIDAVFFHPTTIQAARAANVVCAMLRFRRQIDREELKPIMLQNTIPLCSRQYDRQFNTTRVPGLETDTLMHLADSNHIVVYHKGRYFKMYIYSRGGLLTAAQLERSFQRILDDASTPLRGEEHLAALTAGDRVTWAKTRNQFFGKGVNRKSLDDIEKAAFVVALDEEPLKIDAKDPNTLSEFGQRMLHGKGYDRWFDKSFTLVVTSNGRIGFNGEHSWADAPLTAHLWEVTTYADKFDLGADAPVMGHLWEAAVGDDVLDGYTEDGHAKGGMEFDPPHPVRLHWEIPAACEEQIESSLAVAQGIIDTVDLKLMMYDVYGKGFMKKCRVSPDAYIQLALQLAYFRNAGHFCLTYEASMTRLYREGRTETVRSCTIESAEFVRLMHDKNATNKERIAAFKKAGEVHQQGYRAAMTGAGIDRHLFCLYVVSKYLGLESPFLKEVLSEPWRLSTSQTPHQQTDKLNLAKNPELICAGGGFGPVADDGYGVSYIIAGEDVIFFHVSSKKDSPVTDSDVFSRNICDSMRDIKQMFESV